MNRFVLLLALAGASLASASLPAQAQPPAMAIGQPLPDSSMPAGTVTVRVIAGTPASPVAEAEVTLLVGAEARTAKTDASGRATFRDLPAGATVVARIVGADGKPQESAQLAVPAQGGVRVMLSTVPYTGAPASHGAPAAAGTPGVPQAREMSGQPRADQEVPPGTYQVRLTYNSLGVQRGKAVDPEPPVGEVVTLVGYRSDNSIEVRTLPVDAAGYAMFEGLDISGKTSYFALARLPRGGGTDRLIAVAVQPDTQVGAKVILSGEKRTSTAPPIDDTQGVPTPAGKVRVLLDGAPTDEDIVLYDAVTKQELGRAKPAQGAPDPSNVRGGAQIDLSKDLAPGTVAVRIHGGPGSVDAGLPDVPIRIIPADDMNAEGVSSKTGPDGTVQLTVPRDRKLKAIINVNGKDLASNDFSVDAMGARLDVTVSWEAEGRLQALLDVPYRSGAVVYAETSLKGTTFRSQPGQLVEGAGLALNVTIYPRVLFNFSAQAVVEDELLAVRGTFTVENYSWSPYSAGPDGMIIPLPKGFKGGKVADEHQAIASIAPTEGVRIMRPLPPGRTQFIVGFSLASKGGDLEWRMDLPYGTFQSGMQIRLHEGMEVKPAGSAQGRIVPGRENRPVYVLDSITISPKQSMVMQMTGLPAEPLWRVWVPRIIGAFALAMMAAGLLFAVLRRGAVAAPAGAAQRREQLLDELVELERTGKDPARREQILAELERHWRD